MKSLCSEEFMGIVLLLLGSLSLRTNNKRRSPISPEIFMAK
jgi:hypothetical protein